MYFYSYNFIMHLINRIFFRIMTAFRYIAAVVALLLACLVPLGFHLINMFIEYSSEFYNPDHDTLVVFQHYDKNNDGYLSFEEFKPIADSINFVKVSM